MAPTIPTSHSTKTKKVYITGFGQFHSIKTNPSFLVASSFPSSIPQKYLQRAPPATTSSVSHTAIVPVAGGSDGDQLAHDSSLKPELDILIIKHENPVRVSYKAVDELQHEIPSDADLVLHIGVASSYKRPTVEIRARSGLYAQPDVDGNRLKNGRALEKKGCRYEGGAADTGTQMASNGGNSTKWNDDALKGDGSVDGGDGDDNEGACVLRCAADIDYAVDRFDKYRKKDGFEDIIKPYISDDAGLYLCEYIYYKSLYTRIHGLPSDDSDTDENGEVMLTPTSNEDQPQKVLKQQSARPSTDQVVFIHVPYQTDDDSVRQYVETIMFLVAGMFLAKDEKVISLGTN